MKQNDLHLIVKQLGQIAHVEKCKSYTIVSNLSDNQVITELTLKTFEENAKKMNLFRTHQSHLVNLALVKEIIDKGLGSKLVLENDNTIPLSKRKRMKLKNLLQFK
ncbi:MAG TPA: LytTR family DNA-binding domain-containing protein [Tenuifilaceae bacterium]|nr:LytTR family DNA-binding domain-containing protein [Tenuifilaceae bacterium]